MKLKRIVRAALFTALALIMNLLENMIPPLLAFAPGAKMGLSNVVSLVAAIILGIPDAYVILIVRCLLASVFGGNVSALMYSLPAGVVSLTLQILLYRFVFPKVSLMAISFTGAFTHNAVQLLIASLAVNVNLILMLPLMTIASVAAGLFVGLSAHYLIKHLPKKIYLN